MTIEITNKSTIQVQGESTHRNRKPVVCITEPRVFASESDAAKYFGVSVQSISLACLGSTKLCKGNKLCHLDHIHEHLDELIQNYAKAKAKANEYDKIQAEREMARKEEELREKAALKRAKAIEKAKANVARRQQILENDKKRTQESQRKLAAAISELEAIA